jgi:hypothetical protein
VPAPCQDCGGPKPPGRGLRYCEVCAPKRHVPTVDAATQEAIVRAYSKPRATLAKVAAEFFCSAQTVAHVLEAHDVPLRPRGHWGTPRLDAGEHLLRTQLYGQGLSLARIAEVLGISPSSVAETLRRNGVRLRPVGVNYGRTTPRHLERGDRGRFTARQGRGGPPPRRVPPRAAGAPQRAQEGGPA